MNKTANSKRSLEQFRQDKKRAACPLCALPAAILTQINAAKERTPRREVIAWLSEDYGVTVVDADFTRHISGKHEA